VSPGASGPGAAADPWRSASRADLPETVRTVRQQQHPLYNRLAGRRWARSLVYTAAGLALLTPLLARLGRTETQGTGLNRHGPAPVWPTLAITEVIALSLLPEAKAASEITAAPRDAVVNASTAGVITHNRQPVHVYTRPGGPAIAWLSPRQAGNDTWLPVIDHQPGWVRVLLPSQPNGATGWLTTSSLDRAHTAHEIRVHRRSGRLQLFTDGHLTGTWPIAAGTDQCPTPAGRTFLLDVVIACAPSPPAIALAAHSAGSPSCTGITGTVAIHPEDVLSDDQPCGACLRVPAAAFEALTHVRAGSLVRIYR
jgi:hypothetical protein